MWREECIMVIKALIPVRSGSERVKNKNLRSFAGTSLLELKIRQLLEVESLDGIIVNSNSDSMLDIASRYGVEVIKREDKFANSETLANELYENLADNSSADVLVIAHATSPLIRTVTIQECIKKYLQNRENFDSLVTVSLMKHFLWCDGRALNYDPEYKPRSQDLPNILSLNHAIHILPRTIMKKKKDIIGYRPNFFIIDEMESTDIDTEMDFEIAEFLFNKYYAGGGG